MCYINRNKCVKGLFTLKEQMCEGPIFINKNKCVKGLFTLTKQMC